MSDTLGVSMQAIPGTDVTAWVHKSRHACGWWSYTLFDSEEKVLWTDASLMPEGATAEQVARIAFILLEIKENMRGDERE